MSIHAGVGVDCTVSILVVVNCSCCLSSSRCCCFYKIGLSTSSMIAFSLILGDVVSGDNILILEYRLFEFAV